MIEIGLWLRAGTLVFENIDIVDLDSVPGLYPSARARLEEWVTIKQSAPRKRGREWKEEPDEDDILD